MYESIDGKYQNIHGNNTVREKQPDLEYKHLGLRLTL
jgi:hypothetical protein